ncbi:MAG: hypothetical protein WCO56_26415, partial [Verrucomicrobiota bacterium]
MQFKSILEPTSFAATIPSFLSKEMIFYVTHSCRNPYRVDGKRWGAKPATVLIFATVFGDFFIR